MTTGPNLAQTYGALTTTLVCPVIALAVVTALASGRSDHGELVGHGKRASMVVGPVLFEHPVSKPTPLLVAVDPTWRFRPDLRPGDVHAVVDRNVVRTDFCDGDLEGGSGRRSGELTSITKSPGAASPAAASGSSAGWRNKAIFQSLEGRAPTPQRRWPPSAYEVGGGRR